MGAQRGVIRRKKLKMSSELAQLFSHLEDELTWLHLGWKEYQTLFGTSERRIDLINETAPSFFLHYHELAWRETLLSLCRLTDLPKTGGKNNLTVLQLPALIRDSTFSSDVQAKAEEARKANAFARDWRNRQIAHRSLDHTLDPKLKPLEPANHANVEGGLAALRDVMNTVSVHHEGRHHDFQGVIAPFTGAQAVIYYLSSGLDAEEKRRDAGVQWNPVHW